MTLDVCGCQVAIRSAPDLDVVELAGELDIANADDVRCILTDVAGSTLVVDLSYLTFLDAAGLGAIVGARDRVLDGGNRMVINGGPGIARRVFTLCGLSDLLADRAAGERT